MYAVWRTITARRPAVAVTLDALKSSCLIETPPDLVRGHILQDGGLSTATTRWDESPGSFPQ